MASVLWRLSSLSLLIQAQPLILGASVEPQQELLDGSVSPPMSLQHQFNQTYCLLLQQPDKQTRWSIQEMVLFLSVQLEPDNRLKRLACLDDGAAGAVF